MAQTLNNPDVLTQPIATNGDKNSVPSTNDPSQGFMSQSLGFPPICSTRIADGGKAPKRADFNGAFNLISQHHYFLQNGGTETFRQAVSDAIGGYPINARLWFTDAIGNSRYVRSTIQNNTNNFNNDASVVGAAGSGKPWEIEAFVDDLNTKYVTNCITQIPQDIKLELDTSTGYVTLKAGSKLYRPNGADNFDVVTIESDIVRNTAFAITSTQTILFTNGTTIYQSAQSANSSGTTPPTNGNFYNTSTNTIKLYSGGAVAIDNVCFPLAIITTNASGFTASIDQVFNGFGYLGSTVFALPNVKGLIPNGRNADGTLKSTEFTIQKVLTGTDTNTNTYALITNGNYLGNSSIRRYDAEKNYVFNTQTNNQVSECIIGTISRTTGGVISYLDTKTVFHALDWNDIPTIDSFVFPDYSAQSSRANNVTHTAGKNGWLYFYGGGGGAGGSGLAGQAQVTLNGTYSFNMISQNLEGRVYHSHMIPVQKGMTYIGTTSGSNAILTMYWYPCKGEA